MPTIKALPLALLWIALMLAFILWGGGRKRRRHLKRSALSLGLLLIPITVVRMMYLDHRLLLTSLLQAAAFMLYHIISTAILPIYED